MRGLIGQGRENGPQMGFGLMREAVSTTMQTIQAGKSVPRQLGKLVHGWLQPRAVGDALVVSVLDWLRS